MASYGSGNVRKSKDSGLEADQPREEGFSDGEQEASVYSPMMPQQPPYPISGSQELYHQEAPPGGALEPAAQQPANMDDKSSPTGKFAWLGFGLGIFAIATLCISFCSPYWLQTWPNSFNTFQNLGLWEICMDNYLHHKDDSQEVYNGCWWVFNNDLKYRKLREWLLQPWFIACQVMVGGCLIVEIAAVVIVAMSFLHCCPIENHEYHQTYATFASAAMMFLVTMVMFVSSLTFAEMSQDRQWMPRPDQNFLSWGFGFFIISGMATCASGVCLYLAAKSAYDDLLKKEADFNAQIMEYSGYPQYDMDKQSAYSDYPPASRQGGYAPQGEGQYYPQSQSTYTPSPTNEKQYPPAYNGQHSYEEKRPYHDYDYGEKA